MRRVDAEAGPLRGDLEIVEPGIEDVGPLGRSLREPAHDLRLPTGFLRIYRVPGTDDKLMRGNGALFAVFPDGASRYTARGATTPAGTVYHIGMPGTLHLAPEARKGRAFAPEQVDSQLGQDVAPATSTAAARVDLRIDGRVKNAVEETRAQREPSASAPTRSPPAPASSASPDEARANDASRAEDDVYARLAFGPPRIVRE